MTATWADARRAVIAGLLFMAGMRRRLVLPEQAGSANSLLPRAAEAPKQARLVADGEDDPQVNGPAPRPVMISF